MEGFLLLGFFAGMGHALEADHLAAVGTMAGSGEGRARLVLRGAVWGLGHTLTLFAICTAVIMFSMALTPERAAALEFGVGAMLVLLAADVLRRLRAQRVHFHAHQHDGQRRHIHAHSHLGAAEPHDRDPHRHRHAQGFPLRALAVGLMHGAAGSAALVALALGTTEAPAAALSYVAIFGIGSMAGMATLSFVAAWPLTVLERTASWMHAAAQLAIAAVAAGIGLTVIARTWALASGVL